MHLAMLVLLPRIALGAEPVRATIYVTNALTF